MFGLHQAIHSMLVFPQSTEDASPAVELRTLTAH